MIDIAFLTQTFLRLLSALPVTLGLFFFLICGGGRAFGVAGGDAGERYLAAEWVCASVYVDFFAGRRC
ncbi:hypothetical protein OS12_28000 [Dickeya oryzae]